MNSKLIMTASAVLLAILGLGLTFTGAEITALFMVSSTPLFQLLLQVLGALYFAFAMLNWMAKGNVIGGIYNRPIAIANFAHFFMGGLALVKSLISHPNLPSVLWVLAGCYCLFALLFGRVLFRSPVAKQRVTAVN